MRYEVEPKNVCPISLAFDLEGNLVKNVVFTKGCNGNLKAIAKLVDGMTVEQIDSMLRGNICGNKGTSCADQLAQAVRQKYEESKN